MKHLLTYCVVILLVAAAPSTAGVVVDHPPLNTGGLGADTEFLIFGSPFWERSADDLTLDSSMFPKGFAPIRRITWWGFYDQDNPPVTETMRIRFYGARPGDGLPDNNNILFEESFLDPSRIATGRTVFTGVDPDEYIYEVDLTTPLLLMVNTPFWLEIAQIGDIDTAFRWEVSTLQENGFVFVNPITVDWQQTSFIADLAFQLSSVPEPSALALFLLGLILVGIRRSRKEV